MRNKVKVLFLIIILIASLVIIDKFKLEISDDQKIVVGSQRDSVNNLDLKDIKKLSFPRIFYTNDLTVSDNFQIIYEFNLISGRIIKLDYFSDDFEELFSQSIDLTDYTLITASSENHETEIVKHTTNQNTEALQVEPIWNLGYHGEDAVIAVIDTGIDFNHPSLIGKMIDEVSFVSSDFGYTTNEDTTDLFGHGTSVSSLIAGNDPNFLEYQGMAYEAKLVNVKVGSSTGEITSAGLIAAIDWSASKEEVDIINISLGEPEESPATDLLEEIANAAVRNGKIVVGSAGNSGRNGASTLDLFTIGSPSSAIEAISVGAIDYNSNLISASSEGPTMGWEYKPDFVAPGNNIKVARSNSDYSGCTEATCYRTMSGTSFSTPLISGVFALGISALKVNELPFTPGLLKSVSHRSTIDLGYHWNLQGSGIINTTSFVLNLLNNSFTSVVLPSTLPFHNLNNLPAGEKIISPLTIIGNSINYWDMVSITGNASSFISQDPTSSILGYSQILNFLISPSKDLVEGLYNAIVVIQSPSIELLEFTIQINIMPSANYRLLLDLVHSPWDYVVGSNIPTRLERKFGYDTQDLIEILNANGIWVDELLTGEITNKLLENYDMIWMPSVFVDLKPTGLDREPLRSQKITSEELFALYNFKQRGGNFIIDFGGSSINDNMFESVSPDESSLISLMSLFGIRIAYVNNSREISNVETVSSFQLGSSQYQTTGGTIELTNGIRVTSLNSMTAYLGPLGEKAFISNNRNWRDKIRMDDFNEFGSNAFADEIIKWLTKDDVIDNLDVKIVDNMMEIQGNILSESIEEGLFSIEVWKNGHSQIIQSSSIQANGHFTAVLNLNTPGAYDIEIAYDNNILNFTKEIDLQGPQIEVEIELISNDNNDSNVVKWDIEIIDDEGIPDKNFLITFENDNYRGDFEIKRFSNGYSIEISRSNLGNINTNLIIEAVDALGRYQARIIEISEFAVSSEYPTNNNSSKNNSPLNLKYILLGMLVIQILTKRKITRSRKLNIYN